MSWTEEIESLRTRITELEAEVGRLEAGKREGSAICQDWGIKFDKLESQLRDKAGKLTALQSHKPHCDECGAPLIMICPVHDDNRAELHVDNESLRSHQAGREAEIERSNRLVEVRDQELEAANTRAELNGNNVVALRGALGKIAKPIGKYSQNDMRVMALIALRDMEDK